ncbi:hypothetical protein B0J18DRAFT_424395 [Chaetomium sp. MPI-SDFR-AT-0129]|nr:hypothetical protein B0J18DRAFT_424395 [Chaetomium sp. MPI-SDFR-AT-0129]
MRYLRPGLSWPSPTRLFHTGPRQPLQSLRQTPPKLNPKPRSKQLYSTNQTPPSKSPAPSTPPTPPTNPPLNPPPNSSTRLQTRLQTLLTRLPKPLQPYAARLRGAPITHIVAFLVLHELTAVVPLVGLFATFHYTETGGRVVPTLLGYFQRTTTTTGGGVMVPVLLGQGSQSGKGEKEKSEMELAEEKFARWFRRRGWFGFGEGETTQGNQGNQEGEGGQGQGARVLVEVGLAYVLTKALLPVRIVVSVWATPWFAGVLGGLRRLVR